MLQRIVRAYKSKTVPTKEKVLQDLETAINTAIKQGAKVGLVPIQVVKASTPMFVDALKIPPSSTKYVNQIWDTVCFTEIPKTRQGGIYGN